MQRIVIDCGHGGHESALGSTPIGVVGPSGLREKDVTLNIGSRLAEQLGRDRVLLTRANDRNLSLGQRAELARNSQASTFVSVHANFGRPGERGAETWVHRRSGPSSRALAGAIQRELATVGGAYGGVDRGVFEGDIAILDPRFVGRETAACLVEVDFLSDREGERRLSDPRALDGIAQAIARGVRGSYGDGNDGYQTWVPPPEPSFYPTTGLPFSKSFTLRVRPADEKSKSFPLPKISCPPPRARTTLTASGKAMGKGGVRSSRLMGRLIEGGSNRIPDQWKDLDPNNYDYKAEDFSFSWEVQCDSILGYEVYFFLSSSEDEMRLDVDVTFST